MRRSHGILLFLFGAWIAGTVLMAAVAAGNFDQVKPEKHPRLDEVFARIPDAERVPALRFVASEMNRRYFTIWNITEIGFALVALALVLGARVRGESSRSLLIAVAVIAAICVFLGTYMAPHIVDLGRAIDFIDRTSPAGIDAVARFHSQHGTYMAIDLVKLLVTAACSLSLMLPRRR
ncbi:MAG: hypothetical protein U1E76_22210 [Planctomycetota bacterium]